MAEVSPYADEDEVLDNLEDALIAGIITAYLSSIKIIKPSDFNPNNFSIIDNLQNNLKKELTKLLPEIQNITNDSAGLAIKRAEENVKVKDFSFDYSDPRLASHIGNVFDSNMQAVINTNEETINLIIKRGREDELSDAQIAKMIKKYWGLTPSHVKTVMNYEKALLANGTKKSKVSDLVSKRIDSLVDWRFSLVAANISNDILQGSKNIVYEQMRSTGAIADNIVKQWVSIVDNSTTDTCLGLHNKQAEIGDNFPGGYSHPPAHNRCRSSLILAKRK